MPWCEDCAKYHTPSAMNADGTCPSCGQVLPVPAKGAGRVGADASAPITAKNLDLRALAAGDGGDPDDEKAPWHFKVMMVLLVAYLGWRFLQLFGVVAG